MEAFEIPPPESDDEEEYAFDGRDPTFRECVELWHRAVEWYRHDTLIGVREFAGSTSEDSIDARSTWIASVQQLRATGLFDTDRAHCLLDYIVNASLDGQSCFDDPGLCDIGDRMDSLCRAYGLGEFEDFSGHPHPPAEWVRLSAEYEEREAEMRREILRTAGEDAMVQLIVDSPVEFSRRMAIAEGLMERDHVEERARWSPQAG